MNTQTYITNLPKREFFTEDLSFLYEERISVDHTNGRGPDLRSDEVDKIFQWMKVENPHIDGQELTLVTLPIYETNEITQLDAAETSTDRLETFIAESFLAIPQVEFVFLSVESNSIDIWTVINKLDREAREKIYDVEYDILGFLEEFNFDFHVICRNDRNIEVIRPSNAKMIFPKQAK